ncbi:cytochrome c biogenesis protein ResB, partial [Escherichia coli]|uniref:cytochrome c biogenesis protein ResB n=1 Tax=Escherichia coli TaxID=562 RepID=UPI003BA2586A
MRNVVGWLRFGWTTLTSMRTALILLAVLGVAAVPGSLLPQRPTNPVGVADYLRAHPDYGPWLGRLGFFDVFGSTWFASIY